MKLINTLIFFGLLFTAFSSSMARIHDGDLPALMVGEATLEDGTSQETILELTDKIDFANSQADFDCRTRGELRLVAEGRMLLGKSKEIAVKGVCLDPQSGNVEYLGEYNGRDVQLEGTFFDDNSKLSLDGRLNMDRMSIPVSLTDM